LDSFSQSHRQNAKFAHTFCVCSMIDDCAITRVLCKEARIISSSSLPFSKSFSNARGQFAKSTIRAI